MIAPLIADRLLRAQLTSAAASSSSSRVDQIDLPIGDRPVCCSCLRVRPFEFKVCEDEQTQALWSASLRMLVPARRRLLLRRAEPVLGQDP